MGTLDRGGAGQSAAPATGGSATIPGAIVVSYNRSVLLPTRDAMAPYCEEIILYVGDDTDSKLATDELLSAGFAPEIEHIGPVHPRALYGTPVLFGLGNRFDGLEGVRVFIENAALLGCRAEPRR